MERLTIKRALAELAAEKQNGKEFFKHGSLVVEFYKPDKVDAQTPHTRDEIYVVATGSGFFVNNGVRQPVEPGEVLFAPAGVPHRFVDFTNDFSACVFFYGPEGGEES